MKKYLLFAFIVWIFVYLTGLNNDFILLFKNQQGQTNWQHVANWSSGILIILLSLTVTNLYFSRLEKDRANTELQAIKNSLERRVKERTATLNESNQSLKEEIDRHLETTTQLHSSEHYMNSILKSMPTMLVSLNSEGEITKWNEKAEQYTGVSMQDAIGRDLWEAYPIITITRSQVEETLTKQKVTTIKQNQRGLFHFDITIYPLGDSDGVVLLIDDVSKQVKSDNKLILRDKMSSMGELASSMAHDINTPLQYMLNDIKQIELNIKQLSKKDLIENIHISPLFSQLEDAMARGSQASAIVDNLLNFASSQANSKQPATMTEVMDHSLELAKEILSLPKGMSFSDITIHREYDPNLSTISCHISEIQQVFLSLIRHCFYALGKVEKEDFEPTIRVRILECYDALWLKISHNGTGLSGEEQQSIFEPYFSNHPLDSDEDPDADKRLSFCYFVITEHHRGQMAVTSDMELGTTFHMQFQLK